MLLDEWETQNRIVADDVARQNLRLVTVRRYSFTTPAYIAAAQLREAGILCFVQESYGTSNVFVEQGTIQLNVRAEQAGDARLLLEHIEAQDVPEVLPQVASKSNFWWYVALGLVLAMWIAWRFARQS